MLRYVMLHFCDLTLLTLRYHTLRYLISHYFTLCYLCVTLYYFILALMCLMLSVLPYGGLSLPYATFL